LATFFPFVHTLNSFVISIWDFWIFVEIESAWKKEIYEGSIPVGPGGMTTSIGAKLPTLAAVGTLLASMSGLNSNTGESEKINPTFPLHNPANYSSYGKWLYNLFLSS